MVKLCKLIIFLAYAHPFFLSLPSSLMNGTFSRIDPLALECACVYRIEFGWECDDRYYCRVFISIYSFKWYREHERIEYYHMKCSNSRYIMYCMI